MRRRLVVSMLVAALVALMAVAAAQSRSSASEILIGWAQLVIVSVLGVAYESTAMATGVVQEEYSFETQVFVLYGLFAIARLVLAYRRALPEALLYVSVVADMGLLDERAARALLDPTNFLAPASDRTNHE